MKRRDGRKRKAKKKRREEGKGKKKGNYRGKITKMAEEGKRKEKRRRKRGGRKGKGRSGRSQRGGAHGGARRWGSGVTPSPGGGHQQTAPRGDAADPAGRPHGNAERQNPLRYPYGRLRGGRGGGTERVRHSDAGTRVGNGTTRGVQRPICPTQPQKSMGTLTNSSSDNGASTFILK